ncbi:MAG: transcriptional repressor, partial [Xanthomonadales bacterium]|nr:transcriptional repressor [Xanthomonadales bacterium]
MNDTISRWAHPVCEWIGSGHRVEGKSLKKVGLKVTQPRMRILELLEDRRNKHMTADDIYRALVAADE